MRRTQVCLLLAALVVAPALAACGSGPSDSRVAPKRLACRDLDGADLKEHTNDTAPVPCTRRHTAQTFYVGRFPTRLGDDYSTRKQGAYVFDTCRPAYEKFLDLDDSLTLRVELSWAWFAPSEKGWSEGARWFRCDVVGGRPDATTLPALPRTAQALFHGLPPDAWLSCRRGAKFTSATRLPCSQKHDWRAVSAIKLGEPDDPYPGDRFSEVRARDYCNDAVGAWTGYAPDYAYAYTWFHKAEWQAGNRRAVCWARTDR